MRPTFGAYTNVNRYAVVEDLPSHPEYERIIRMAGVADSQELREELRDYVFVIGPAVPDYRWVEELPRHKAAAKAKEQGRYLI